MPNPTLPDGFRLRAGNFSLLVLRLLDPRPEAVLPALGDQFRRAPGFLRFAPVAIGLHDLQARPEEVDFRALVEGMRALEIVPIGVIGGDPALRQAAIAAGLPPLRSAGGKEPEVEEALPAAAAAARTAVTDTAVAHPPPPPPPVTTAPPPNGAPRPAMLVTEPVRSGQRIYAPGADLIVTATVNAGAEVIADGNVHVYGALRGKAVAGAADDRQARVFALSFDPELVAVAGLYAVREDLGADALIGRAAQVRLDDGERLRVEPLG